MKRITSHNSGKGCKYLPEFKSLPLALQFYLAKVYEFVCRTFNLLTFNKAAEKEA